jgi:hypothetical protein
MQGERADVGVVEGLWVAAPGADVVAGHNLTNSGLEALSSSISEEGSDPSAATAKGL